MTVTADIEALREDHGWTWSRIGAHYGVSEREARRWSDAPPARAGEVGRPAVLDWETALVLSDPQYPYYDPELWDTACQIAADVQPDLVSLNGDILDFPQLSSFDHDPYKLHSAEADVDGTHERLLEPLLSATGDQVAKQFILGNHEYRYLRYIEKNAGALGGLPGIQQFLKLDSDWSVYDYGKAIGWEFGNMLIAHGWRANKYSAYTARWNLQEAGRNVLTGHTHRVGMFAMTDSTGTSWSYEMGHMAREEDLPKRFEGHNNWQQAAGAIVRRHRKTDVTDVDLLLVRGGKHVVVDGRTYRIEGR